MSDDILKQLNEKQAEAASVIDGPLLIIAGPGSGKTRTLTHRVAYMISQGIPAHNILAVTFTNKAAGEMKERITDLLTELKVSQSSQPTIGTFHSICARILRVEAGHIGYNRDFTIFDSADSQSLIKDIRSEFMRPDSADLKPRQIQVYISSAKNEFISPDEYRAQFTMYPQDIIGKVYARYQEELKRLNAVDFDDLLGLIVTLFEKHPSVLEKYQEIFKYILIDEYQDTNTTQYKLISLLAKKYNNICVVGDDAQAIYMFRGADYRNILRFEKDFPNVKVVMLEQNYRSTQVILNAANDVIKHNKYQAKKELWTQNDEGKPIHIVQVGNEQMEGEWIARRIEKLNESGTPFNDIAVLYRTNAQSRAIEQALIDEALPYNIVGGIRFFERKEIKDVLAYLRYFRNPRDVVSLARIINTPARGLGKKSQELIIERIKSLPDESIAEDYIHIVDPAAWGDCPLSARAKNSLIAFLKVAREIREDMSEKSVYFALGQIITKTGYENFVNDGSSEGQDRYENVKELLTHAKRYDGLKPEESIAQFLEDVSLIADTDQIEDNKDVVNLMTLHAAKGLEFEVVFLVGMEEGLFPHSRSHTDPSEMEEERRLCFVGITRAKSDLYLTHASMRTLWGSTQINPKSRFIEDIDDAYKHIIQM